MGTNQIMSEFIMHNDGTIALLAPKSDEATAIFEENFGPDPLMYGGWYVVENRYLKPILMDLYLRGLIMVEE